MQEAAWLARLAQGAEGRGGGEGAAGVLHLLRAAQRSFSSSLECAARALAGDCAATLLTRRAAPCSWPRALGSTALQCSAYGTAGSAARSRSTRGARRPAPCQDAGRWCSSGSALARARPLCSLPPALHRNNVTWGNDTFRWGYIAVWRRGASSNETAGAHVAPARATRDAYQVAREPAEAGAERGGTKALNRG